MEDEGNVPAENYLQVADTMEHPKSIQTARSYASSAISFTNLEQMNPLFFKTMSLPVHPEYIGFTFRTLPQKITRKIPARRVALFCLILTVIVTVTSFINLMKEVVQ